MRPMPIMVEGVPILKNAIITVPSKTLTWQYNSIPMRPMPITVEGVSILKKRNYSHAIKDFTKAIKIES